MLRIKLNWITQCSNMVANSLPADPPDPRVNSTFAKHGHIAFHWNHVL